MDVVCCVHGVVKAWKAGFWPHNFDILEFVGMNQLYSNDSSRGDVVLNRLHRDIVVTETVPCVCTKILVRTLGERVHCQKKIDVR